MPNVAVVLVTYNPNLPQLLNNINSYCNQAKLVVIVDNSDVSESIIALKNLVNLHPNIHLIQLNENRGIASAQNIGIAFCKKNGFEYFIEMDQDSSLEVGYIEKIYSSFVDLSNQGIRLLGVGPVAISRIDAHKYHTAKLGNGPTPVDKTLSSGLLTTVSVFDIVGKKDEDLFIDLVDWEWCFRAKSLGYSTYVDPSLEMSHMLGDGHINVLGFKVGVPAPIRHYYQYRNSLLLLKRSYIPTYWKIERFFINFIKVPVYLFFFNQRWLRLKYSLLGCLHFICGKKGKLISR